MLPNDLVITDGDECCDSSLCRVADLSSRYFGVIWFFLYFENSCCNFWIAVNWLVELGDGIPANSCFSCEMASMTLSSGDMLGIVIS